MFAAKTSFGPETDHHLFGALWTLTSLIYFMADVYNPENITLPELLRDNVAFTCQKSVKNSLPDARSHTPNGNLYHLCVFTSATSHPRHP